MAVPDLLRALLSAAGPSGREDEATAVWRDAAAGFAEVSSDAVGTAFARVRRVASDGATLALVGHIDEIGIAVTHIEDSGALAFTTVGGIGAETLLGQRFDLLARGGRVPAVIGRRRMRRAEQRDRPKVELTDLHLDIGATSREDAERLVRPGDVGVWRGELLELPNERIVSKALDNRLGAYVVLEAARRVAERGIARVDVVAVASTQEENGHHGARAATYALDPAAGIAVDVTWATDVPGADPREVGRVDLGAGATISLGPTLSRSVSDLLIEGAEAEGIPYAIEVYTGATHTDADEVHRARAGVPTGVVGIPLRHMHTPNELCSLADVESAIRLVTTFAERFEPGS